MLLAPVEEDAGLLVARERTLLVGVPQPLRDPDVLECPPVARGVVEVLVAAVVARGAGVTARHDVPAGSPAADVVEGVEAARDVERLVVRRREGADQADVAGVHRDRRQQGQRLQAAEVVVRRVRRDELAVDDKDEVELGRLGLLGAGDVPLDVDARIGGDVGTEPGVVLTRAADSEEDGAELEGAARHGLPFEARMRGGERPASVDAKTAT